MIDAADRCAACGVELAPGMLACPGCRKLVHAARLKELASEAEGAERDGRLTDALSSWRSAFELLPAGSTQHRAVGETIRRLSETVDRGGASGPTPMGGGKAAAGIGAAALIAWKLKFVLGAPGKAWVRRMLM